MASELLNSILRKAQKTLLTEVADNSDDDEDTQTTRESLRAMMAESRPKHRHQEQQINLSRARPEDLAEWREETEAVDNHMDGMREKFKQQLEAESSRKNDRTVFMSLAKSLNPTMTDAITILEHILNQFDTISYNGMKDDECGKLYDLLEEYKLVALPKLRCLLRDQDFVTQYAINHC